MTTIVEVPGTAPSSHSIAGVRVPNRTTGGEYRAVKIVLERELLRFLNDRIRIVITIASLVGVPYDPLLMVEVFAIQLLLAFTVCAFGMMMASRIQQMQSFMALNMLLIMPM